MLDLESYIAEISLTVAIVFYGHASVMIWDCFFENELTSRLTFFSFIWFYSIISELPWLSRSFAFLYWKNIVLLSVFIEYHGIEFEIIDIYEACLLVCVAVSIIVLRTAIILSLTQVHPQEEQNPGITLAWEVIIHFFDDRIGLIGIAFIPRWWVIWILFGGLVLVAWDLFEFMFQLIICLYAVSICQPKLPAMPASVDIPCFSICDGLAVIGRESWPTESISQDLAGGLLMFSISAVSFLYHYLSSTVILENHNRLIRIQ